ncbi:MAG: hypothetical protein IBJ12_12725 [Sphingomonadaceae bacterium]|nr:hypothetical protein [Sphingomonadaceae bacterium]
MIMPTVANAANDETGHSGTKITKSPVTASVTIISPVRLAASDFVRPARSTHLPTVVRKSRVTECAKLLRELAEQRSSVMCEYHLLEFQ